MVAEPDRPPLPDHLDAPNFPLFFLFLPPHSLGVYGPSRPLPQAGEVRTPSPAKARDPSRKRREGESFLSRHPHPQFDRPFGTAVAELLDIAIAGTVDPRDRPGPADLFP